MENEARTLSPFCFLSNLLINARLVFPKNHLHFSTLLRISQWPLHCLKIKVNSFQHLQSSKNLVPPSLHNVISAELPYNRNLLLSLLTLPTLEIHSNFPTLRAIQALSIPSHFLYMVYLYHSICLFIYILLLIINWILLVCQLCIYKEKQDIDPFTLEELTMYWGTQKANREVW